MRRSDVSGAMLAHLTAEEQTKVDLRETAYAEFQKNAAEGDYFISLNNSRASFIVNVKQKNNEIFQLNYQIINDALSYQGNNLVIPMCWPKRYKLLPPIRRSPVIVIPG